MLFRSEDWRYEVHKRLKKLVTDFSSHSDGSVEMEIRIGYPCLINDKKMTEAAASSARRYLGPDNVVSLDVWMASEDFAFYSQKIPACFYRIGTGNPEKGITSTVHTPTFNIDEDALGIAPGMMAWIAIQLLSGD